ncbi:MAG: MerR family transcriptional regulator [Patescibacteria group bacterium]|nr:MerR family transcriptional regulator [Patescibacteria group bacterium]MDE2172887.1 MerR family transcriptional regulator [Patescibacteria group bacterium]
MDNIQVKLITIRKAAEILGVTPLTLRNWDNSGKFPASRHPINNYRVYRLADIERLLVAIEASKGTRLNKKAVRRLIVQHLTD